MIAAGALHDTIENTDADDLQERFGSPIATLVLEVTENDHITRYQERKAALRHRVANAGHEALMIFAADKISKARELHLEIARTREPGWQPGHACATRDRKLAHYSHCLELLEQLVTDSPLVKQLRTELEKLPSLPIPAIATRRRDLTLNTASELNANASTNADRLLGSATSARFARHWRRSRSTRPTS